MAKATFSQGATRKAYQQSYRMRTGATGGVAHIPKTKFAKAEVNMPRTPKIESTASGKRDYAKTESKGVFGSAIHDIPQITNLTENWMDKKTRKPKGFA